MRQTLSSQQSQDWCCQNQMRGNSENQWNAHQQARREGVSSWIQRRLLHELPAPLELVKLVISLSALGNDFYSGDVNVQ